MWPFASSVRKLVDKTPVPAPAPPRVATVVLTWAQTANLIPALAKYGDKPITPASISEIYDTLLNSVVMPPDPWAQSLVRFSHVTSLPHGMSVTIYFIFYPL